MQRRRQRVLGAKLSNSNKPRLASVRFRCEDTGCNFMENILRKSADHSKQTELPPMDVSNDWRYASQEVNHWIRALVRELHK